MPASLPPCPVCGKTLAGKSPVRLAHGKCRISHVKGYTFLPAVVWVKFARFIAEDKNLRVHANYKRWESSHAG